MKGLPNDILSRSARTIQTPAKDLWSTINRKDQMEAWYPGFFSASDVPNPNVAQPKRHCRIADGGELKEHILLRDDATRTFIYSIDSHQLPAKNVVGSLRIDDLGDGRSTVTWGVNMVLVDAMAAQMTEIVMGIYVKGLESLEAYHAGK